MDFTNNCIYKTGYSSGMQLWLDTYAILDPQNLCYMFYYHTGSIGGSVSGTISQILPPNAYASAVTAIPAT